MGSVTKGFGGPVGAVLVRYPERGERAGERRHKPDLDLAAGLAAGAHRGGAPRGRGSGAGTTGGGRGRYGGGSGGRFRGAAARGEDSAEPTCSADGGTSQPGDLQEFSATV